ncbi:MAG: 23S rRNA (guanosine(2251)-2'-O)-methyltransferase RlmB [Solobacterium sp.]|nr:23S rRNA (guanosine(2251)-2'-O)-methyltransferase RlmB [Solobacterium sp.]
MTQILYGRQVVRQVLKENRKVRKLYLQSPMPELEALAKKAGVPVVLTDRKKLNRITESEHHQGVAVEIEPYETVSLDELIRGKKGQYGFLIMLDELEDPHNLGAVLRTADAVNADGVIIKKTHSAGLTPTVAKVSAGAIDTVKVAAVTNLTNACKELKKQGYWIVGADMDGVDYRTLNYDFHAVLVIGNEGKGISRLVRENCDHIVSLPMRGTISSLNASVSAGILMYGIDAKRNPIQ